MSPAPRRMRDFAERLIASAARGKKPTRASAFQVIEDLRPHLQALTGNVGFRSLLSRAVALANAEIPWLRAVHVKADGSLEGLDELGSQLDPDDIREGTIVLLARMLELLLAFIGEDLTLRLVRDVWPSLSVNNLDVGRGDR